METQRAEPTVTLPPWSVDEAPVLRDAKTGDMQAFRQLVMDHQARVFGAALRLTHGHAAATELAQEVFVALYGALARITDPAHLAHWLLRAVSQGAGERVRQMAGEVVLVEPPDQPPLDGAGEASQDAALDPGAEFTARVMVRVESRRSHRRRGISASNGSRGGTRRRIVWAALVLGTVAAAVLLLHGFGLLWPAPSEPGAPTRAAVATVQDIEATPAAQSPVVPSDAAGAPDIAKVAARTPTPQDPDARYTVIAMPLRQQAHEAAARAPVEAFHAALLDELRKVPGVTLLVPGITAAPPDASHPADYLLTVTSLETSALATGGVAFRVTGGEAGGTVATSSGQQWPVEIRLQPLGQPQSGGFTSALQVGTEEAAAALAARQVEVLRLKFFPDAITRQQLMARLRDGASSGTERERALSELLGTQQRGRGPALDMASIGVIVQQTASMRADQRAQLWRDLRGFYYPELVDPLLDSLRRDPEEDVRYEALATLAADYAQDQPVRDAIEVASREDPEQIVRMAAQRALQGQPQWREQVIAKLGDSSLLLAERLAPLLFAVRSAATPAERQDVKALVNDAQTLSLLAGVVREGWFDPTQAEAVGDALGLLGDGGSPAASAVLVQVMQESPKPAPPAAVAPPAVPQVSPASMAWLNSHRGNPRVRRMLDDIARGNPDPRIEAIVEQMRRAEQMQRIPQRRPGF